MPPDLRRSVPPSDAFYIAGLDDYSDDVAASARGDAAPELAAIHDGDAAAGGPALPNRCASLALAFFAVRGLTAPVPRCGFCRTAAGIAPRSVTIRTPIRTGTCHGCPALRLPPRRPTRRRLAIPRRHDLPARVQPSILTSSRTVGKRPRRRCSRFSPARLFRSPPSGRRGENG